MEVKVLGSAQTAKPNYNYKISSKSGQNNKTTPLKAKNKQGSDNSTLNAEGRQVLQSQTI